MSTYSRTHSWDDSTSLLLPSNSRLFKAEGHRNSRPSISSLDRRSTSYRYWMPFVAALTLVGMVSGIVYIPSHGKDHPPVNEAALTDPTHPIFIPPSDELPPISSPELIAHQSIQELYGRQSHNLEQASSRYTLKSGHAPPPNYDKWFQFAQENKCLIDEYDRVHRDFQPFYQLARDHPEHFQTMVDSGRELMLDDSRGMTTIRIRHGEVQLPEYAGTPFDADLQSIVQNFAYVLPDMEFLLNGRDEPRVAFNVLAPSAQEDTMRVRDPDPFRISPVPTADFFKKQSGCDVLSGPSGFGSNPIDVVAFLRSSSTSDFTTDLWPLLSMTKISPCFSDILFPGAYFYDKSFWSGKFMHPNDVAWEDKKPKIYWRGMSNGGHIYGQNYRQFPRFRLVELSRNHSDLVDAKMTAFAETHCAEDCDREAIIQEYGIEGPAAPREDLYKFKYLLDIDGNTFSGRFLGLLRSGSLVFKSTAFEEYFNDWLRPYEHYIPVRVDLSDLTAKIEWAIHNEAEARVIQERGKQFAQRVMTDKQNDCYFAAVLLEWARLQTFAVNATAVAVF
ncbi:glycosyl transferase family 90-domain-containing protein [Mycena crocata]|nr:glycosyl transferase family 90-domain-containing protein [Mycena crocata]